MCVCVCVCVCVMCVCCVCVVCTYVCVVCTCVMCVCVCVCVLCVCVCYVCVHDIPRDDYKFSDICQAICQNGRLLKIIEVTLKYQLQMLKFL